VSLRSSYQVSVINDQLASCRIRNFESAANPVISTAFRSGTEKLIPDL